MQYNSYGYSGGFGLLGGGQFDQLHGSYPWVQQPLVVPHPLQPQVPQYQVVPQPQVFQPPIPQAQPPAFQPPQAQPPQVQSEPSQPPQPSAFQSPQAQPPAFQPPAFQPPQPQPPQPPQPSASQPFAPLHHLASQPPRSQTFAAQPLTHQPLAPQPFPQPAVQRFKPYHFTIPPESDQSQTIPSSQIPRIQLPSGVSRRSFPNPHLTQESQSMASNSSLHLQSPHISPPPLPPNKPQRRSISSISSLLLESPDLPALPFNQFQLQPQRQVLPSQSEPQSSFHLSSTLNQDLSSSLPSSLQPPYNRQLAPLSPSPPLPPPHPQQPQPQQQQQQQQQPYFLHLPTRDIPESSKSTLPYSDSNTDCSHWNEDQLREYLRLPIPPLSGVENGDAITQMQKQEKIEELRKKREAWVRLLSRLGKRPDS